MYRESASPIVAADDLAKIWLPISPSYQNASVKHTKVCFTKQRAFNIKHDYLCSKTISSNNVVS